MTSEKKTFGNTESDLIIWRKYYDRISQKAVYHSPHYVKALESHFGGQAELFVFGGDDNFIYYPYLRRSLANLPFAEKCPLCLELYDILSSWYYGGPLISSAQSDNKMFTAFLDSFHEYAMESGVVTEFVRLDANLKNYSLFPDQLVKLNRETVYVDLSKSDEEIWSDFSSANRRAIRKASKAGFIIHATDKSDIKRWTQFHEIYDLEMHRKNSPRHLYFSLEFFLSLKDRNRDNTMLLTVEKNNKICGGFIIVFDHEFAFHFLSATMPEHWPDRVNNLLFYNAIIWAKNKGCLVFDFMGGRAGVYKFKSNFSRTRGKFYTYQRVHNQEVYDELVACHRSFWHLPFSTVRSYFPEYREQFPAKK